MASSSLVFTLLGVDAGASAAIKKVGAAAAAAGDAAASGAKRSEAAWASMSKVANRVGAASAAIVVGVAYEGVKAAANFEQAMARVHTQAGASNAEVKALSEQVLKLSPKVGVGPEALATSLYHVESAGFRGAAAMAQVAAAAKLSQIGGSGIEESTQAIIATMASRIKGVKDANDAVALLNTTVGTGDMKMSQLTEAIATGILPTAAQMGLSFEDVGAALATMTDNATPAVTVARNLKTALLTLVKPSTQQANAFGQIGMSTLQLANDFRKPDGLNVAVKDFKAHLDATYPAGQTTKLTLQQIKAASQSYYRDLVSQGANVKDATKMTNDYTKSITAGGSAAVLAANTTARAFGGSKTAGVFMTLLQESDRLNSKYKAFGDTASRAAKLQEAWNRQQDTYKQKVADLKATWDVFLVRVGNAILPALKDIVTVLAQHPVILQAAAAAVAAFAAAWALVKVGSLISSFGRLGLAIVGIGTESTVAAGETSALRVALAGIGTLGAVGALAAIAYGLYKIGTASDQVKEKVAKAFSPIDANGDTTSMIARFQKAQKMFPNPTTPDQKEAFKFVAGVGQNSPDEIFKQAEAFKKVTEAQNAAGASMKAAALNADGYQLAMVKLNQQLGAGSVSLLGNSKAAAANRDTLSSEIDVVKQHSQYVLQQTGSVQKANAALSAGIGTIEANAAALGLNKSQVIDYIAKVLGIPPSRVTDITTPGLDIALAQINDLAAQLARVEGQHQVDISVITTGSASPAEIAVATAGGRGGTHSAGGGLLRGPGTGLSDSIRTNWLANGEFVVNAKQTAANLPLLNSINSGASYGGGGGGTTNVYIQAWDGQSVDKWLNQGGAQKIAEATNRRMRRGGTSY